MSTIDILKYKKWIKSNNPEQRLVAIGVFWHSGIRDDEIDESLKFLLQTDDNDKNRREAMRMIKESRDETFFNICLDLLDDSDWMVRGLAFQSLKLLNPLIAESNDRAKKFAQEEIHDFTRYCINN
jgi:hypothetical protein